MGKLIVFEWMSLDGVFDAGSMGEWWEPYDSKDRQKCIQDMYMNTDAYLMGRITYEMLMPYWSGLKNNEMGIAAKFNSAPKYVVSSSSMDASWNNSIQISSNIETTIKDMKQKHAETIIIGSAHLIQSLMGTGLIDEYKFLIQPIIVGEGKRFFGDDPRTGLELIKTEAIGRGVVSLHYRSAPHSKSQ